MEKDSYNFQKGFIQVRKTECKRKYGLIIITIEHISILLFFTLYGNDI